jgi:hypothetical protein
VKEVFEMGVAHGGGGTQEAFRHLFRTNIGDFVRE